MFWSGFVVLVGSVAFGSITATSSSLAPVDDELPVAWNAAMASTTMARAMANQTPRGRRRPREPGPEVVPEVGSGRDRRWAGSP